MSKTERNKLTGLPISKRDESQELNMITGTTQTKKEDDVSKSDGKIWPSISDRDEDDSESEPLQSKQVDKSQIGILWPSISGQFDDSVSGKVSKTIPIFTVEKKGDERIVAGIVYEPDVKDAQGDQASAEEIEKAANYFMENVQTFKVMHKGKPAKVKVLQSYIAPQDLTIGKKKVKKGSWVLVTRVLDKKLWEDIKAGKFTGYSMAGTAKIN